ncbi:MAG: hypothetical protein AABX84_03055 [Nanoarchaeota archaeon]
MEVHIPRSIGELERLTGKLVKLRMNKIGEPVMIETFSGIKELQMSPINVLSQKYPKRSYYEFLHQLISPTKNGRFQAMNDIIGRLYSVEESKNRFDFSEEGIFLGYPDSHSGYGGSTQ